VDIAQHTPVNGGAAASLGRALSGQEVAATATPATGSGAGVTSAPPASLALVATAEDAKVGTSETGPGVEQSLSLAPTDSASLPSVPGVAESSASGTKQAMEADKAAVCQCVAGAMGTMHAILCCIQSDPR
jgi:hypothetical protein